MKMNLEKQATKQCNLHRNTMIQQYFSSKFRAGSFAETIIIATLLFLQNVNDSNNNSFQQHFSSNPHVGQKC